MTIIDIGSLHFIVLCLHPPVVDMCIVSNHRSTLPIVRLQHLGILAAIKDMTIDD